MKTRFSPGERVGPYEIAELIGCGGMGEVYRAIDKRLGRSVAIKVIAERYRDRPDLRSRFKKEMTAIAALTHTHICRLYDVGEYDGADYLVMELVEGQTLGARLARGRLRPEEALRIAREVADALDAAHRRGILHRDLKPSNVMLTKAGTKLLDFGVAQMRTAEAHEVATLSTVPGNATSMSETDAPIGTWQYMAPEQIRGEPADARTDIFSLGAVMYEMLTGRRAFAGATRAELVAAILGTPPALEAGIRATVGAPIEAIVRTCLENSPDARWQSAGDVCRALEMLGRVDAPTERAPFDRRWLWGVALALVVAAAVVGLALSPAVAPFDAPVLRAALPTNAPVITGTGALAVSPDGETVVFTSRQSGPPPRLYARRLDADVSVPIEGATGGTPFFSPDGQWVGFCNRRSLFKVPLGGGQPTPLAPVQACFGASWGDDGFIVYSPGPESGLRRVAATGGESQEITHLLPEDHGNDHRWPQVLPGARGVLFTVGTGPEDDARIVVLDTRSGTRKELVRGSASARYVPTGHLVYARNAELRAMPFDLDSLEVTGPPVKIAGGVLELTDGAPEYAFSTRGDLVYVAGASGGQQHRLVLVDLAGTIQPLPVPPGPVYYPRVSPDGNRIAFSKAGAKNNVWMLDLNRGTTSRMTFGRYHEPVWLPDGTLVMSSGGPGSLRLVRRSAEGSGEDEELTSPAPGLYATTISPDGTLVIYQMREATRSALWQLDRLTGKATRVNASSTFNEWNARLSPDGRWLAYISDESGRLELYVRAMTGEPQRELVSNNGAEFAAWSPDGRRLYYRTADPGPSSRTVYSPGAIWSVEIDRSPRLRIGKPRLVLPASGLGGSFDMLPDGKRFVTVQVDGTPPPQQLQLVQNWRRLLSANDAASDAPPSSR